MQPKWDIVVTQIIPAGDRGFVHYYDEAAGSHRWWCTQCIWERKHIVDPKNLGRAIDPIQDSYKKEFYVHVCAEHRDTQSN